jgi:hypothetical protein
VKCKLIGYSGKGGSIDGLRFSQSNGTYYSQARKRPNIRHYPIVIDENDNLIGVAIQWIPNFSSDQKAAWNDWAAAYPWQWGLPPNTKVTGYNWFVRAYLYWRYYTNNFNVYFSPLDFLNDMPTVVINSASYSLTNGGAGAGWVINFTSTGEGNFFISLNFAFVVAAQPSRYGGITNPSKFRVVGTSAENADIWEPGVPYTIMIYDFFPSERVIGTPAGGIFQTWVNANLDYGVSFDCLVEA